MLGVPNTTNIMNYQEEQLNILVANSNRTIATLSVLTEVIARIYTKVDPTSLNYEAMLNHLRGEIDLRVQKT